MDSVRTGTSVVPALRGKSSFEYFADNPELSELFNQTMTSVSKMTDATVVAGYDFSAYPRIVDVGGGHGPLLAAIMAAAPASRGVLYDLPRVVATHRACCASTVSPTGLRSRRGRFSTAFPAAVMLTC